MMNSASWRRMRLAVRLVGAVLLSVHGARAAELSGDLVVTGKVGVGVSEPAHRLDVGGDINMTGDLLKNGEPLSLGSAGGVSNVTATAPLSSSGGTEPNLSIQAAGAAQAGVLSSEDWTRFDAAHGWGNHADAGYLTTYTETDPTFAASTAAGIDAAKVANWNAAYGWGNHALAGYLTSYTETDPLFAASAAAGLTADSTNAWNAKLDGSGTANYLPKFTASGTVGDSAIVSDASGNVGIGTATPAYKLDVAGSLNASGITIGGVPVASSTDTYWSTNAVGNGAIQYSGGNVGIGTATPAASAALEVTATDKGMLVPRLTLAQRDAVASPATGLLIYQTDNTPGFYFYDGAQWSSISAGAGAVTAVAASSPLSSSGGSTPTLSMPAATALANGYLSSTDWTAFNAKADAGANSTITSLTGLTTDLSVAQGGTGASTLSGVVHGNGTSALTAGAVALASEVSGTLPVANGGTGAATASAARSALGAASSGANSDITSLSGLTTDLSVAQGGTGASTLSGVVHGNGTSAMTASAVVLASEVSGTLPVANGGTGAATASAARSALGAASSGANSDITSLTGLTTDLSVAQGGTGASTLSGVVHGNGTSAMTASAVALASEVSGTLPVANGGTGAATASAARSALGAAASGANSDITSLTGLTTPLSVAQGGTGRNTATSYAGGWILYGEGNSTPGASTALVWDRTNSRLGIGDSSPSYAVDVAGDVNVTGSFMVNGSVVAATPAGAIMQFAGSTAPTGYLLCDGSSVSRTTYAALFTVIGTTYGYTNATTFKLPNLSGKVPAGRDSTDGSFNALGETGGAKTHALTTNEIPAHVHQVDPPDTATTENGTHTHGFRDYYCNNTLSDNANDRSVGSAQTYRDTTTESDGAHTHTVNVAPFNSVSAGGGGAHNNLQPYIVLNYIIKY